MWIYANIIINKIVTNIPLASSFHMSLSNTLALITRSGTTRLRNMPKSPPECVTFYAHPEYLRVPYFLISPSPRLSF